MSNWQTVLYWASLVVLWILIGLNLWSTSRNFRTWKKQKKHLEELEQLYDRYVNLCKTVSNYIEEKENETDAL